MWELVTYKPLLWLAAAGLVAAAAIWSLVDRPRLLFWLATTFRAVAIVLLVIALCRPYAAEESDQLHVNFLVDISQSVDLEGAREALGQIDRWTESLRPDDTWHLFTMGRDLRQFESTVMLRAELDAWRQGVADDAQRSATRISKALLGARLTFPAGKAHRLVLLSDGQATDGPIEEVLTQLDDEGIDVRRWPLAGISSPEASVVSIRPSSRAAFHGEISRMGVKLAANQPLHGNLRIVHKGVVVEQREVDLKPDAENLFYFEVAMLTPGRTVWTAELVPDQDHFPINNRATATVHVHGRPRVLLLHQEPKEMRSLVRALREQEIEAEVRGQHGMPESLAGLAAFDAIVLANLPATMLSPRQMERMKRYVTDLGGGLVMLGSDNSSGLGGHYKTPVEEVLPRVSRFEKEKEKPSLAMVLVIDKSGSMNGLPIELARQAAKAAVELLGAHDTIGVVGFDGQPQVICAMTSAMQVDAVQASIDSLAAGGGTYMYPAMVVGKEMLETTPAKIRHMICLSDGHTQPADHETLAEEMADAGITVSTVALGAADQQLLARIAELGRGRYYATDDPANVPQIFTKETMQATKSAIKEDLYGSVRTADHPLLGGTTDADLPMILGYVMTECKPTAQLLLAAETGDPLLAVGRYGLGTGLAYTSDLTEKWGGEWLAWEGCGRFWAQALRGVLRQRSIEGLQTKVRREADGWQLEIRSHGPNAAPQNGIAWDAIVLDQNGNDSPLAIEEVGLGRYRAVIPRSDFSAGQQRVTVRLHDTDHDKTRLLHFHEPYPAEYRLGQKLPPAIDALPVALSDSITGNLRLATRRRSVAHFTYFSALACLLISILLRRL